jgi:prevent-host-death family protein
VETVSIEAARHTLGDLVDLARFTGEPTVIARYRRPAAVLVSVEWFERAQAALAEHGPQTAQGSPGEL